MALGHIVPGLPLFEFLAAGTSRRWRGSRIFPGKAAVLLSGAAVILQRSSARCTPGFAQSRLRKRRSPPRGPGAWRRGGLTAINRARPACCYGVFIAAAVRPGRALLERT